MFAEQLVDFDEVGPIEFGPCGFEPPIFPGGQDSLSNFVLAKFDPLIYEGAGVGIVYISFVIDTAGFITNVKVARGINPEIDLACLKIVENLPQWLPAEDSKGNKIPLTCVMPFRFLEKEEN